MNRGSIYFIAMALTLKGGLRLQNVRKISLPNQPLVSVVTVVLNNQATIASNIESVLSQTYGNIEHIIIDGGSTDGTIDIIRKYEDRIAYWQSEPDKGISNAWNKGIGLARGDWIHILNSDDFYATPDCLARVIEVMGQPRDTFYYFTLFFQAKNGSILRTQKYPFNWINYWKLFYSAYIAHPTLLVSRKQYQAVNYYDESFKICADHDLILRLCQKYRAQFVDIPLTIMREGGVSERDMVLTFGEFKKATVKNGFPSWLAEVFFRFKLWKYQFRRVA